jgi:hydrogenase maturation protease
MTIEMNRDPVEPLPDRATGPWGRRVLIGVGNHDRGDDSIGPLVADAVQSRTDRVVTIDREGDLAVLPLLWDAGDDVLIVDACRSSQPVGTVELIDPDDLEQSTGLSTHGLSVVEALQLARRLGRMPNRLRLIGVVGRRFGHESMSPALRKVFPSVVDAVMAELGVGPETEPIHSKETS